jgi:transcriptional regulator with XRE-family HTH domain
MVFTVKKVESSTFGEKLKKAREEAGLTKQKVAQLLSIQSRYIDRLEGEEFEKLPSAVYTKGFLRKYAKYLSLEPENLIREYEKEMKIIQPALEKPLRLLPELRFRRLTITPKTLTFIAGLLIVILVAGYLAYQLDILISPPKLLVSEPSDNITTDKFIITLKGQVTPGVKLTINGQETSIDRSGNFEQEVNLNQGLNVIRVEAVNRFEKKTSVTREILVK